MRYLSFGAGVNSMALMLLLLDEGVDFEAVFVDTGCEWPETYAFLKLLQEEGFEFIWLKPVVEGVKGLYNYLRKYKTLPSQWQRFCTAKFKVKPFYKYTKTPCTVYIGYSREERKRRWLRPREGVTYEFPLIDRGISRVGCKNIIASHGLSVPPRSGCWLCPFQNKDQWKRL